MNRGSIVKLVAAPPPDRASASAARPGDPDPALDAVGDRGTELRAATAADDAPYVRAVAGGDLSALGVLYDRHFVAVRQFLRRVGLDVTEADDVAQDVFLSLRQCATRYDGRASARPLLLGIAARRALRVRDRVRRWARAVLLAPSPPPVETPDETLQRAEERRRFDDALARISERKRVVFIMVEREGLSSREVADALGVPIGTVWTRLHHARADLVRRLSRGGGA